MLTGAYRELLPAIATAAASLTGLLFVALSVASRRMDPDRPLVIRQVRAAASLLAFTNALSVALFSLVPGTNAGYPAIVVATIGIFFTAAGTRSIFSSHLARRHVLRQIGLITILLAAFGCELAGGIDFVRNPRSVLAGDLVSNVLVALLLIGIARAWELVGDRDTGIVASIAVLTARDVSPGGHPGVPAPGAGRGRWGQRPGTGPPGTGPPGDRAQ